VLFLLLHQKWNHLFPSLPTLAINSHPTFLTLRTTALHQLTTLHFREQTNVKSEIVDQGI
jgi:hypothetical protein